MENRISDAIPGIIRTITRESSNGISAFMGFDACIDIIVRVVKEKDSKGNDLFFDDSKSFGEFISGLDNRSCGLELSTTLSKTGGNMVIMANALGNLGIASDCFGTFGVPDIQPVFQAMSANCSLITIGETISASALEFNNSKIIMFDPGPYKNLSWEKIKEVAGFGNLLTSIDDKQLIAFVNWSEIDNSTDIWKGFLDDVFPLLSVSEGKPLFFTDLSDCTRRSKSEIAAVFNLLNEFREYFTVIISFNANEARLAGEALGVLVNNDDGSFIRELHQRSGVDQVVIHRHDDALAFDGVSYEYCTGFKCKQPVVLTGGGDNFNAGFCYGRLKGLDLFDSLLLGNAVAGYYVRTGKSPALQKLADFLHSDVI